MVRTAKETGKIVQIGSQRVSSVICAKAKEILAKGTIGELTLVEGTYGRNDPNGAWEYPTPTDLSPQNFDWDTWQGTAPKKSWDPDMSPKYFARWRCWKEYGTGVAGDLMVHLISGMQFVLGINEVPKRVMSFGGIYRWKDGRNMPDVQPALFEYMGVPLYMRLSLGCESTEVTRFMGSKGVIEMREFSISYSPQPGVDLAPSYYTNSYPAAMRAAYVAQWHKEHDPVPGQEPAPETISFNGNDYDDLKPHLYKFFQSVRSRQPVVQDAVFGNNAALACHLANESYFRGHAVAWNASAQKIESVA
jgi:predicted dehydrogenase